jgi:multiple sugar transport system permease protein
MASREIARYRTPASRVVGALTAAFLALFVVWTVLPIFIMFVSSFKDLLQAFQLPPVGQWSGLCGTMRTSSATWGSPATS